MLTESDIEWLAAAYPGLKPSGDRKCIDGTLKFVSVYDKVKNLFTIVGPQDDTYPEGVVLSGFFRISIIENNDPNRLPKLLVNDSTFPHNADRHFFHDQSACVCGVVEEAQFMAGGFDFKVYLEKKVIPFLYGQKYYSARGEWPWRAYSHSTPGILESYFIHGSVEYVPVTLKRLRGITEDWNRIKSILKRKKRPKGHTPCFCRKADFIRRCHLDAWRGLIKLHVDVLSSRFPLEDKVCK